MSTACRLHEPGHHTVGCRPSGSMGEAFQRLHDAVVDLFEATGIPAALRRWTSR